MLYELDIFPFVSESGRTMFSFQVLRYRAGESIEEVFLTCEAEFATEDEARTAFESLQHACSTGEVNV